MAQFVTITSQGQISIPANVRKLFGLDRVRKLLMNVQGNKIILEPAPDILELEGIFEKYAIQNKPIKEVMKLEKEAMGKAFADNYKKKHNV